MDTTIDEMQALVARHAGRPALPGFALHVGQSDHPTPPVHGLYRPMLCFILQGAKRVILGERVIEYGAGDCLIASVDLPVMGEVVVASAEHPYRVIALMLDPAMIADLLIDLPSFSRQDGAHAGISFGPISPALVDPLLRLLRLFDAPDDIAVMAPMLEREVCFRLLQGPHGALLRQIAQADSRLSRVRRAIDWIRQHYARPLHIDQLARLAGMSVTSFHRHFKAVTAMTPLAYHKQIRLVEARRQLVTTPAEAARVAYAVGYESASQFSREYTRQFGLPPQRDAARLRGVAPAMEV